MERVLRDKFAILVFVMPAFVFFSAIVLVPVVFSVGYSTLKWDGIGYGEFVWLQNYIDLFTGQTEGFLRALQNSFILAILSVFIQLPIALTLALILASGIIEQKYEKFFRTVFFIPVIISTVVIGQLWMKIYHPSYGLLNGVLTGLGLDHLTRAWLGDTSTALIAVLVPLVWQYVGLHMLLMYTAMKSIPEEIFEAAQIDGASKIKTSLWVTVPLIKPIIKVCIIQAIIGSLKAFDLIFILTNGGPVFSSEVPSTLMYSMITNYSYGSGSAVAIIIVLECLLFTVLVQKFFKVEEFTY